MADNIFWEGWETLEQIGSGGFSKVYKIRKLDDDEDFYSALKVVSIPQSKDEYMQYKGEGYDDEGITSILKGMTDRVISEFKLMRKFRGNSNIVSYEDHMLIPKKDMPGWDILIRMELCTPLPQYYNQNPLSAEETVKLGADICNALILCEKENIVHRDIKPHNIFVGRYGDYKLGDFGIARVMDHATRATRVGTPTYIAPEVYNGAPSDNRGDIYCLGMVLYWLLNERRLPFIPLPPATPTPEETEMANMRRLRGEPLPPPKNGSPAIKAAVMKAIAFNPADRFATAAEFKAALTARQAVAAVPAVNSAAKATAEETVTINRSENKPDVKQAQNDKLSADNTVYVNKSATDAPQKETPQKQTPKKGKAWILPFVLTFLIIGAGIITILLLGKDDDGAKKQSQQTVLTEVNSEEELSQIGENEMSESGTVEVSSMAVESETEEDNEQVLSEEISDKNFSSEESGEYILDVEDDTPWKIDNGVLTISSNDAMSDHMATDTPWYSRRDEIETAIIEDGVTFIGDFVFSDCYNLKSVSIPNGITCIGMEAFYGCDSLVSITIPDSVTSVGDYAFYGCDALVTAYYTGNAEQWGSIEIGSNNENLLSSVIFEDGNSSDSDTPVQEGITWKIDNGVLTISGNGAMEDYIPADVPWYESKDEIKTVIIENGVTSIMKKAFYSCEHLTSITIGNSVTSIGDYAFSLCSSLESVTFSNSVTYIEDAAFSYCDSLVSITIPDSVTSVGDYAFKKCTSLTSITIGGGVTSIGDYAFDLCDALINVYYIGSAEQWWTVEIGSYNENLLSAVIFFGENPSDSEQPNDTPGEAGVTWRIDNGVLTISGNGAMEDYIPVDVPWYESKDEIKKVTIENGVTSIMENAFAYCDSFTSITIPDSVVSIGDLAFANCYALTSITIPNGVSSIGNWAFNECSSLASVNIPDSVSSIGKCAFRKCSSLASVIIPDGVTFIGEGAFSRCSSLVNIYVDNANQRYCSVDGVLYNEEKTNLMCYPPRKTDRLYVVPDSVASIDGSAFNSCCFLRSITIGSSVTYIGDDAFAFCYGLIEVVNRSSLDIEKQSTNHGSVAYYAVEVHGGASKIITIGDYGFYVCSESAYLTHYNGNDATIILPNDYVGEHYKICSAAFYDNDFLINVTIGNCVTSIGEDAFSGCDYLTSITIPHSVTSIGAFAFYDCPSLTTVDYTGSDEQWDNIEIGDFNWELPEPK